MNFRVSLLALTIVFVSFQNCSNVVFENDGSKIVSKLGTETEDTDHGAPPDNNEIPEHSEEELAAATCSNGTEEGYLICHFPPGHWQNFETLCVGKNALEAHLRHGHSGVPGHPRDLLGSCEDNF